MKAPTTQLGSAAAALAARLAGGFAAGLVNQQLAAAPAAGSTTTTTSLLTSSTVDLASAGVGAALFLGTSKWKKFGLWLGVIGAVDYLNPVISPMVANDAPQLSGKLL